MLKKFFRRLFFRDAPAAGAVFGWMISAVSGYCLANFICYSNLYFNMVLPATAILQLLLTGYSLFLSMAFFFRQDRSGCKWIFWSITAAHIIIFFASSVFDHERLGLFACGVMTFAGFNALCIRKNNYLWYIAQIICWLICLPGLAIIMNIQHFLEYPTMYSVIQIAAEWRIPAVFCAVFFLILFAFSNFKLWSSADNKRLRDVWGTGCNTLLILLAVSYIWMLGTAFSQQKKCDAELIALEKNFQRKISAAALQDIYYRDRKADEDFHRKLEEAWENFPGREDHVFNLIISESAALDKLPEGYREKFFSPQAEKIGTFFDAPLPARPRDFSPGRLISMLLPDLQWMRQSARLFAWQIRLTCENKDHAKMMQAWKRLSFIPGYLEQDTTLIAALVLCAVEKIRMETLSLMISSNLLSIQELSEIQHSLQISAGKIPKLNRNALYCEAVMGNDTAIGLINGTLFDDPDAIGAEGAKRYRFLMPGVWYLANCNYRNLLRFYNAENLCEVHDYQPRSLENFLANMLVPALNQAGTRMHEIEMLYQTYYSLAEAEKIKRKYGKYPEKLPVAITDHFSGKPLLYKVGSHEVKETYLMKEKPAPGAMVQEDFFTLEYRIKTIQAVAVWSVGKNKENENGIARTSATAGKFTDDLCALLVISRQ